MIDRETIKYKIVWIDLNDYSKTKSMGFMLSFQRQGQSLIIFGPLCIKKGEALMECLRTNI